jgi:hypothetical protein
VTGWAQTTQQLHECPVASPRNEKPAIPAKAYENGIIIRFDPRLVDVAVSPVRLPVDFWRRAILREHVA